MRMTRGAFVLLYIAAAVALACVAESDWPAAFLAVNAAAAAVFGFSYLSIPGADDDSGKAGAG